MAKGWRMRQLPPGGGLVVGFAISVALWWFIVGCVWLTLRLLGRA